jgi:hypothetical protein
VAIFGPLLAAFGRLAVRFILSSLFVFLVVFETQIGLQGTKVAIVFKLPHIAAKIYFFLFPVRSGQSRAPLLNCAAHVAGGAQKNKNWFPAGARVLETFWK